MSPNNCWISNWVIVVQSIFALLLNAIVVGVIFARISRYPAAPAAPHAKLQYVFTPE